MFTKVKDFKYVEISEINQNIMTFIEYFETVEFV